MLCKFESLYNCFSRSNIHDTTNVLKDMELVLNNMEPKFWCLRHVRFDKKDVMVYVRHTCMWQLDDEYSCCSIEPQSPIINICEEIDNNSATREPTLIKTRHFAIKNKSVTTWPRELF